MEQSTHISPNFVCRNICIKHRIVAKIENIGPLLFVTSSQLSKHVNFSPISFKVLASVNMEYIPLVWNFVKVNFAPDFSAFRTSQYFFRQKMKCEIGKYGFHISDIFQTYISL